MLLCGSLWLCRYCRRFTNIVLQFELSYTSSPNKIPLSRFTSTKRNMRWAIGSLAIVQGAYRRSNFSHGAGCWVDTLTKKSSSKKNDTRSTSVYIASDSYAHNSCKLSAIADAQRLWEFGKQTAPGQAKNSNQSGTHTRPKHLAARQAKDGLNDHTE